MSSDRQQQEQEAAEARRAGEAQRAEGQSRGPQSGRLPDGSRFEVTYDAAKQQWSGSLTVPTPGGGSATFAGSGSGLFPLLAALDGQYRASLAAGD